jgi:hypothetical protein
MVSAGPVVSVPVGGGLTVRVVLTTRETLPVESAAVTVMLLNPIARGIFKAAQFAPFTDATPDAPVLEDHVTAGVPLPPVTVPESEIVAEVVAAGTAFAVKARGGGVTACRVTLTVLEELPVVSVAVTVMLLSPIASGILAAVQLVPPTEAVPDAPVLETQVTTGTPLPPVTVPESDTVADVVVVGVVSMERVSGAGDVPVCAA